MEWDTIEVPNPNQYTNRELFFAGHLDSDNIGTGGLLTLSDIDEMKKKHAEKQATDKLTESFMKLGSQSAMVVIDPDKEVDTYGDGEICTGFERS